MRVLEDLDLGIPCLDLSRTREIVGGGAYNGIIIEKEIEEVPCIAEKSERNDRNSDFYDWIDDDIRDDGYDVREDGEREQDRPDDKHQKESKNWDKSKDMEKQFNGTSCVFAVEAAIEKQLGGERDQKDFLQEEIDRHMKDGNPQEAIDLINDGVLAGEVNKILENDFDGHEVSPDQFEKAIDDGNIVAAWINEGRDEQGDEYGHEVIITGYDDDRYTIWDPATGEERYEDRDNFTNDGYEIDLERDDNEEEENEKYRTR